MANTSSGEVGVYSSDGREFIFRPSFRALSEMGNVKELWSELQCSDQSLQTAAAGIVLDRCMVNYDNDDFINLFGVNVVEGRDIEYLDGLVPLADQCILAFSLLRNGLLGSEEPKKSTGKGSEFNPIEWVGAAMAAFSQDSNTAWELTMHEFQAVMKAKYPDADDKLTPEKANDFLQELDDIRAKNNG